VYSNSDRVIVDEYVPAGTAAGTTRSRSAEALNTPPPAFASPDSARYSSSWSTSPGSDGLTSPPTSTKGVPSPSPSTRRGVQPRLLASIVLFFCSSWKLLAVPTTYQNESSGTSSGARVSVTVTFG